MRHLFLPACICLMTLSGAAGAGEIPSEPVSATKRGDGAAPAPAAEVPAGEFPDQAESSPPKTGVAETPAVAADVPMPIERPPPIEKLDSAAKLDHRVLSLRTLWLPR